MEADGLKISHGPGAGARTVVYLGNHSCGDLAIEIWLCKACCENRVVVTMVWKSCLGALALESLQACFGNLAVETLLWKPCCGNHALTAML